MLTHQLYGVIDLQGEKEELDWSHMQAYFEALPAKEEIQEGGEPMPFDALVSGSRMFSREDQQGSRVRSKAGCRY